MPQSWSAFVLHSYTLKMEAAAFSEMFVTLHQVTRGLAPCHQSSFTPSMIISQGL